MKLFLITVFIFGFIKPLYAEVQDTYQMNNLELHEYRNQLIHNFNSAFNDGTFDNKELKEVSKRLSNLFVQVAANDTLSNIEKTQIIKPIAEALGDRIVMITDPLENPVTQSRHFSNSKFQFALNWLGVKLKSVLRDITRSPKLLSDYKISKTAQIPIDSLNKAIDNDMERLALARNNSTIGDFFMMVANRIERSEPVRFQKNHSSVFKVYIGLAVYMALVDRPDVVGALTGDLNYWSPAFSAVTMVGLTMSLAFNRAINSGRGVLNSYKNLVKKIKQIESLNVDINPSDNNQKYHNKCLAIFSM